MHNLPLIFYYPRFSPDLQQIFGPAPRVLCRVPGSALSGLRYRHPLSRYLEAGPEYHPLLAANHVTLTAGTGLVHTAPAHGQVTVAVFFVVHYRVTLVVEYVG